MGEGKEGKEGDRNNRDNVTNSINMKKACLSCAVAYTLRALLFVGI